MPVCASAWKTLVESKNLTMVNIYNQKPVSVDDMWNWCKHFQEVFGAYICDVGQYLADADDAGKKIMFEAQLGALRDIDYGIYPYTTSSNTIGAYAPIAAWHPRPQAEQVHRYHEGLFFLRGRRPLYHRAGYDRGRKAPAA